MLKTNINIAANKNWGYRVYKTESGFIISVPFGSGAVDFSRAFRVELESLEEEYLKKTQDILDNYDSYKKYKVTHP